LLNLPHAGVRNAREIRQAPLTEAEAALYPQLLQLALTKLQAQGKLIYGGYPIGRPAMVLLVEAHSEKELYEILKGLPLWEQVEVEVTRMWDYEELEELD
jgi:Muconolactone delta-isomerase